MSRKATSFIPALIGVLILVSVVLSWGVYRKSRLDDSSQQLAIAVTESVFVEGNFEPLIENAHSSLIEQYTVENLRKTLISVSEIIGPLELIESIAGTSNVSLIPFIGSSTTASYAINARFNESNSAIVIELLLEDGEWKFTAYRVDSPLLLN